MGVSNCIRLVSETCSAESTKRNATKDKGNLGHVQGTKQVRTGSSVCVRPVAPTFKRWKLVLNCLIDMSTRQTHASEVLSSSCAACHAMVVTTVAVYETRESDVVFLSKRHKQRLDWTQTWSLQNPRHELLMVRRVRSRGKKMIE